MKKSKFPFVTFLIVIVCAGAAVLWYKSAPPPSHLTHPPHPVRVGVARPFYDVPGQPLGEEKQMAGNIIMPPMPEHVPALPPGHKPEIAIVIDDMGLNLSGSQRAMRLPAAVTLSFMPYATRLEEQTTQAREAGHELMLHMPMEPIGREDPGPGALLTTLSPADVRARFQHALVSFEGFDGVNNHMGSRFTAYTAGMEIVMNELQKRHLFFLDSRTSPKTVGETLAHQHELPTISRDVFLDDSLTPEAVRAQLAATERVARHKGYAVAIGHPHEVTLQVLESWIPEAEKQGFILVPVHNLLKGKIVEVNGQETTPSATKLH